MSVWKKAWILDRSIGKEPNPNPSRIRRACLDLGLSAARQAGVTMPTTSTTRDQIQTLIGHGFDQDFSQLLLLEALASGLELKPEDNEIDDGF